VVGKTFARDAFVEAAKCLDLVNKHLATDAADSVQVQDTSYRRLIGHKRDHVLPTDVNDLHAHLSKADTAQTIDPVSLHFTAAKMDSSSITDTVELGTDLSKTDQTDINDQFHFRLRRDRVFFNSSPFNSSTLG
jgi:hypothetical protein